MIKIIMFTLTLALSAISTNAQTENPRGIYKLSGIWGKDGQYFKEPFDQYKICADNVTLMMTMRGKDFSISRNDKTVFNYTGPDPKSPDDKSSLIYDSDANSFKLKWWSNFPNHQIFPSNDWCIEYYKSTELSKEGKIIVEALQSNTVSDNKKDLKGRWRLIGWLDELKNVKKEVQRIKEEYPKSNHYNKLFHVFGDGYVVSFDNNRGYIMDVEYLGSKAFKIVSSVYGDQQGKIRKIKWISDDLIAIQFEVDYRIDYQIFERIKDDKPVLDYILERYQ